MDLRRWARGSRDAFLAGCGHTDVGAGVPRDEVLQQGAGEGVNVEGRFTRFGPHQLGVPVRLGIERLTAPGLRREQQGEATLPIRRE